MEVLCLRNINVILVCNTHAIWCLRVNMRDKGMKTRRNYSIIFHNFYCGFYK